MARGENYLYLRVNRLQLQERLGPAHPGHDIVDDRQGDFMATPAIGLERRFAIFGYHNSVSITLQNISNHDPDPRVVIRDQDQFGPMRCFYLAGRRPLDGDPRRGGEVDPEGCSLP